MFNKLAQDYQDKFMDVNLYRDSFNLFCDSVQAEKASIIEIACGPGNITQFLLYKRPDFNLLGTDLAPNMVELARLNNPSANFKLLDCREIKTIHQKFDGAVCGFCLPYLSKEEAVKLISDLSEMINPNGILYLSTIEGDYESSTYKKGSSGDEIFMHYYTAEFLKTTLEQNGFEIISIAHVRYPGKDNETVTDVVVIAKI